MGKIRTFIGVKASERVTRNIASVIDRMNAKCDNYRWMVPENLHVTMNFVGDVKDIEIPELCNIIKGSLEPFERFEMSLQGVSGFSNAEEPRVLWMGVDEGSEQLHAMYDALAEVLHHWGVNKDRNAFLPHMTLGRLAPGGRWNQDLLDLVHKLRNHDGGFCNVTEVKVLSSFMDRSGPTYTPMATIRL